MKIRQARFTKSSIGSILNRDSDVYIVYWGVSNRENKRFRREISWEIADISNEWAYAKEKP